MAPPLSRIPPRRGPIFVDYRKGSIELLPSLTRLGLPAVKRALPVADFTFRGNGPTGSTRIGIERKTITEMAGCVQDDRFTAGQLPKMLRRFGPWSHVIVEGMIRPGPQGQLQRMELIQEYQDGRQLITWRDIGYGGEGHSYSHFMRFISTLRNRVGVIIIFSGSPIETCYLLHAMYNWWQKRWNDHKSTYKVREFKPGRAILEDQTLTRRLAAQLPGIYWTRSRAVAAHFGTPRALGYAMWRAQPAAWTEVTGIGKGIATNLCRVFRGEREP
jgi:ERCC4-type nuclease